MDLYNALGKLECARNDVRRVVDKTDLEGSIAEYDHRIRDGDLDPNEWQEYGQLCKRRDEVQSIEKKLDFLKGYARLVNEFGEGEDELISSVDDVVGTVVKMGIGNLDSDDRAVVSIRPGAGPKDECYVETLSDIYCSFAESLGYDVAITSNGNGRISIYIEGKDALGIFKGEDGVHRFEYMSEKYDKMQTMFVGVDVKTPLESKDVVLDRGDIEIETFAASSKGGQHANRSQTNVRVKHSSGLVAQAMGRSQSDNLERAIDSIKQRLQEKELKRQRESSRSDHNVGHGHGFRTYDLHAGEVREGNLRVPFDKVEQGDLDMFVLARLGITCTDRLPR